MEASTAAKNALECVLEAKKGESIIIFCDNEKTSICEPFVTGALKMGLRTRLVRLRTDPHVFRNKIPQEIIGIFNQQRTEIYLNLVRGIREETPFRIELTEMETKTRKSRLAHCPGITLDMLTEGALALTCEDHKRMQGFAENLIRDLNETVKIEITNPSGTQISMNVKGRPFFTDTIIDWKTLNWMNLPTGEVIVAPVEDSMEGTLICDMAVGGIGPVTTPVEIAVKNGKVQNVLSKDAQVSKRVKESLATDERANIVGEFAFGINPKARFVEEFLEAEKILGTTHIAFGNNADMPGGKNPSKNHMDLLISKPTVKIYKSDNSSFDVLEGGSFQRL